MSLADTIRQTRQKALMSQEDFAKCIEVSMASITRWEGGKSVPNIAGMKKLKSFCEDNNLSFQEIEAAWLIAKDEERK